MDPAAPTVLLYHADSLLLRFRARVIAHARLGDRDALVLDQTAFYPEAGGQMADRGMLAGLGIADVQVDGAGVVRHAVERVDGAALPDVGSEVEGAIDRARRRAHMALHTGQHMLSRALVDVARADTVSSRLGETAATIDVGAAGAIPLAERDLAAAEALVNSVIDDDVAVRAWFPDPGQLAALPLRREPKVESDVRVVEIGAFDVSPCGGTHCTRSAQVGLVRVLSVERYKGGHRIVFEAGERARQMLGAHSAALRALGQSLSCPPLEVAGAIERLRAELKAAQGEGRALKDRLAAQLADALVAGGPGPYVASLDDGGIEMLRALARRLAARSGSLAFLAARGEAGLDVVVSRGEGSDFDCGAFVKRVAAACGGRGGGRANHAEGRLPGSADWAALVETR